MKILYEQTPQMFRGVCFFAEFTDSLALVGMHRASAIILDLR